MQRKTAGEPVTGEQLHNLRVRPIRPDDWHRLQRFHRRLSEETVGRRFHGAKRELSTPLAHRLTQLEEHDAAGFVATTGTRGRIVGVGRYFRVGRTCAEVAFVVEDAYQHHGVGRWLLHRLIQAAREDGITAFVAEVLADNAPMLHLLQEAGPTTLRFAGGVCEARVDLTPIEDAAVRDRGDRLGEMDSPGS